MKWVGRSLSFVLWTCRRIALGDSKLESQVVEGDVSLTKGYTGQFGRCDSELELVRFGLWESADMSSTVS